MKPTTLLDGCGLVISNIVFTTDREARDLLYPNDGAERFFTEEEIARGLRPRPRPKTP